MLLKRSKNGKTKGKQAEETNGNKPSVLPKWSSGNRNLLPAFVLITGAIQVLVLLGMAATWLAMASRKPPTLVELQDGTSVQVRPLGSRERSAEAIQNFTVNTLRQLFGWTGQVRTNDPKTASRFKPDPGVQLGNGERIATPTWRAGFALSTGFREPFLERIAEMTPDGVFKKDKNHQAALVMRRIAEPEQIGVGKWKVPIVSDLVLFENGDRVGEAIAFNKNVFVRAIDTPDSPAQESSNKQRAIYQARKAGMEIYKIEDLSL